MEEAEFKYIVFDIIHNPDRIIQDESNYIQKLENVIKPRRAKQAKELMN